MVKVEFMMLPVLVSPNTAPPFCPAVLLVKAVRMMFPARTGSAGGPSGSARRVRRAGRRSTFAAHA